jgi:hypothetical protein
VVRAPLLSEQFRLHGRRRVRCLLGRPLWKVSWPRPKPDSHSAFHLPSKVGGLAMLLAMRLASSSVSTLAKWASDRSRQL